MKWYNSVKSKLIGFFLFVSLLFLVMLVITFFIMREQNLGESASKEAALMTSKVLQVIKTKQIKAEETVLSLASISSLFEKRLLNEPDIIPALLSAHQYKSLEIVSGGIWFEPSVIKNKRENSALFFNREHNGSLKHVKTYASQADYRHMDFYLLGKKTEDKETSWTEAYIDPVTKVRMITVVSPIFKNRQFMGVATIDLAIDREILAFIGKENMTHPKRYLMMIDKKGNFIGKSSLIEKFTDASNLFGVKNRSMKKILHYIKPSLESGENQVPCRIGADVEYLEPFYREQNAPWSVLDEEHHIKDSICIVDNDPILHESSIIAIYHFPRAHWNVIIGIPKNQVLARQNELFYNVLLITVILTLLATILGYTILQRIFVKPIRDINMQLQSPLQENTLLQCRDKGEIGMLVENLNARTVNLAKARERESKEHQLRLAHEEMLMQQSKMAVMGEMMDSVAHQWKQPLNALTLYSELIRNDFEEGHVDQAYIEEFRKNIQIQIDHMVNTLDEFRSFFRPNKEKKTFKMIDVLNSALFLAKDDILKNRILVKIEREDPIEVNGYENEFKHLILNIINNAKDAFIENDIHQRLIRIRLIASEENNRLEIEDNAGGVPEEVMHKIFEANVTTKEEGKGTGIGLYMSRQIAQKHNATLTVENREGGACFIVTFHKND